MNERLAKLLFTPISGVQISLFRFCLGLVIFYEFGRLVIWDNRIEDMYTNTVFHFKYPYMDWVVSLPDEYMIALAWLGSIISLLFAVGAFHRFISPALFAIYAYFTFIDISYWNNHYYFFVLLLFLFIFIPPRNLIYKIKEAKNSNYSWQINILKFMVVLVLFYGGVSKLYNPDWMNGTTSRSLIFYSFERKGIELSEMSFTLLANTMTWFGLLFDLFGGFLLLNRRTFWYASGLYVAFHISNMYLFSIGSFPFAMLGSIILFLPSRSLNRFKLSSSSFPIKDQNNSSIKTKRITLALTLYICFQILIPLRHFFVEGNCLWTGETKLYSWHMMSGASDFQTKYFYAEGFYKDPMQPENKTELYPIDLSKYLNYRQRRAIGKFPALAPQFANFIVENMEAEGYQIDKVFADVYVSRNQRASKAIINPQYNLVRVQPKYWSHNDYVLLYLEEGY